MQELVFSCESSYNGMMNISNRDLEDAIFNYSDNLITNHYVTEAVQETLWTRLKDFFIKIAIALKNFAKDLQIKITHRINEKQIRQKLDSLRQEIKDKKRDGAHFVQVVDYWSMQEIFDLRYDELIKYAKKFSKVKYTKTWQIEEDLAKFDKIIKMYDSELEKASQKKIKMTINRALDFVEDEIRGKTHVMTRINDSIRDFSEIEKSAEELRTRMNVLGVDVIPKHVGLIQKMVNSISSFVRRWTIKIIMGIVFIFTF